LGFCQQQEQEDKSMSEDREAALTALQTLSASIDTLSKIAIRDLLIPATSALYEQSLQAAYDELTTVEEAVDTLGEQLEYHHCRLGGALEELRQLRGQTSPGSDADQTTV
jgi:hypothetical protein